MSQIENKILKNDPFENKIDISDEITHDDINTRNLQTEESDIKKENEEDKMKNKSKTIISKINDNDNRILLLKRRFLYKFVGKTLFIFSDKNGNPIFIIGPDWGMYICFNGTITLIMISIFLFIYPKFNYLMKILGIISFLFFFLSYTLVFLINPGYPKNELGKFTGLPRKKYYFCDFCHFWIKKDSYATHCYDCDICIEGYDHHCPWTGHCIGKKNLSLFYAFLFSTICIIGYFAAALTMYASKS